MLGREGSLSPPTPDTSTWATTSPREVAIRQRRASSSHSVLVTSWSKRMCGAMPKRRVTSRR
jgi:hypothetical protein